MALPSELATKTVTRLRGTSAPNAYGDATTSWTSPARLTIEGCAFQPEDGQEILADRTAVISRWRWFGPPEADVRSSDRLEVDGIAYDIDGSVQKWDDPDLGHQVALCRRADG